METSTAIARLSALAHATRLDIFRLLVKAGPDGLAAGQIAEHTGSLPSTLSTNLALLSTAGLTHSRRDGRSIIYCANYDGMSELLSFLMADCCSGAPEICAPVSEALARTACCVPERA